MPGAPSVTENTSSECDNSAPCRRLNLREYSQLSHWRRIRGPSPPDDRVRACRRGRHRHTAVLQPVRIRLLLLVVEFAVRGDPLLDQVVGRLGARLDGQVRIQPNFACRSRVLRIDRGRIIDVLRTGNIERGGKPERGLGPGVGHDELLRVNSFETFVVENHRDLHSFASRLVGSSAADDVVSETFASAWASWSSAPDSPDARRAWAFGIAHHRSVDLIRAAARHRSLIQRLASRTVTSPAQGPDRGVLTQAGVEALTSVLTAVERDALLLTAVGGLSCAAAATVLGCSETAVTSRLSRARDRLRNSLAAPTEGR